MPETTPADGGLQGQILLELGKLSTSMAVIDERTKQLPEIMTRLRAVELAQAEASGARDGTARWVAVGAALVSGGSMAAAWVAILHH